MDRPTRNGGLVLPVCRSKLELQRLFLSWCDHSDPDAHEQAPEQDGDASKENRPSEPESNFSQVHRVPRDRIRAASKEYLGAPVKRNPRREFRPQAHAQYEEPDKDDGAGGNGKETKEVPRCGPPVDPTMPMGQQ